MAGTSRGYGAIAATILIWGSAYPITYIAERGVSPIALAALRAAVGGAFLAVVFRRVKAGLREFIGGVINIASMISLLNLSVFMVPNPSTAAIMFYTQPLFTALMTPFVFRRKVIWQQYVGIGVGIAGITSMTSMGVRPSYLPGILIGLAGGVVWALGTIYFERYLAEGDVPGETAFMSIAATPVILAMWPLGLRMSLSPYYVGLDFYIAIVVQGLGWLFWFYAVKELGGVRAGALSMLTPVVAITFTALMLHESLTGIEALGAGLIVLGSSLVQVGGLAGR
ncbi:MAG: DMT family transporter [Acidilobus sp.]